MDSVFERHRIEEEDTDMLNCTAKRLREIGPNTLFVGIDIGKKKHACVIVDLRAKVLVRFKFSNSRQGFESLLEKVEATRREAEADHLLFRMEPTDHYWRNLAYFLEGQGFRFHFVNLFTLKRHREGQDLSRTKNKSVKGSKEAEEVKNSWHSLTIIRRSSTKYLRGRERYLRGCSTKNIAHLLGRQ